MEVLYRIPATEEKIHELICINFRCKNSLVQSKVKFHVWEKQSAQML